MKLENSRTRPGYVKREAFERKRRKLAELAEDAADDASRRRYLLMEQTYLRLAETEEWLDGRVSPFAQHAATRSEG
jgi:hypothetical protein